ncbi:S8/S53 family peptidase [Mesorhizobium loti]|nr:S8/S53 family peptidase [Mesorhizobium loti]
MRFCVLSAAVLISVSPVAGQDLDTVENNDQQIVVIETPTKSALEQTESVLMESAGPIPATPSDGDTFRALIGRACPGASDSYMQRAEEVMKVLNNQPAIGLDQQAPPDQSVYIPYCVGQELKRYVVKNGDNLWKIYQGQRSAPEGIAAWETFQDLATYVNRSKLGANGEMKPGSNIYLPKPEVSVPLWKDTVRPVIEELKKKGGVGGVELSDPNWGYIQADSMEECSQSVSSTQIAETKIEELSRILTLNKEIDNGSKEWERSASTTLIGVFDSGIDGISNPTMKNSRKRISQQVLDEDMGVLPEYDKKFHGSGVNTVAQGGHILARLNPLFSLVDIAPYRIIENRCDPPRSRDQAPLCNFRANPERLTFALGEVQEKRHDVSVVNISASFKRDIKGFSKFRQSPFVIVVAAGNSSLELNASNEAHPAMSGGDEVSNIITVAGVDGDRKLMASSGRSTKYVDIAAWGCNVPVLEYDPQAEDFVVRERTGTSYSAPQVSFAAAMVSQETKDNGAKLLPVDVKKRLLFSADIEPSLWSDVKHGRVLNTAKALSVYSDWVELSDGKDKIGRVTMDGEDLGPITLCPDVRINRADLRKIAQLDPIPDGGKKYLIYSEDSSVDDSTQRKVDVSWCDQLFAKMSVLDWNSGKSTDLDLSDVKDVVFASSPYWE